MADTVFQQLFEVAAKTRGASYAEARGGILALQGGDRKQAVSSLEKDAKAAGPWERTLTARILWTHFEHPETVLKVAMFARGELPGPEPISGFQVRHRAAAISALGPNAAPRVLEMLYKTNEIIDDMQESSLFAAAVQLNDPIAVDPMIEIVKDENETLSKRMGALGVLSHFGDARALDAVLQIANDSLADAMLRETAIRSLAGYKDPRAGTELVKIVSNDARPLPDREAASSALGWMANPATLKSVRAALATAKETPVRVNLLVALSQIGTREDLPAVQALTSDPEPEVAQAAADAVRAISAR